MTAASVLAYPTAIVNASRVRALIDKQCEVLRTLEIHPELARCTNLSIDEIEQTIAAHTLALRYLKETP